MEAVRLFVQSLLPHLAALSPAELYVIAQQGGLLSTHGRSRRFAAAFATNQIAPDDLDRFARNEPSAADSLFESDAPETTPEDPTLPIVSELGQAVPDAETGDLPAVPTASALAALDQACAAADAEAIAFLLATATAKLWRHAFRAPAEAVAQARGYRGGQYAEQVRQQFLAEYRAACTLRLPAGYAFTLKRQLVKPNLMQRLVAIRLRRDRRLGNWSGTGAGKTLAAILASRVIKASLTVVCCPNAVVGRTDDRGGVGEAGWATAIAAAFPDSLVATRTWMPKPDRTRPRYLILNYERFQQPDSEAQLKAFLERERVDCIIIDEVHHAKQRYAEDLTQRRRLVQALVLESARRNPGLHVQCLSATPVINNLQEGRSLVELVTGCAHEDLLTRPSVGNAMRLHQRLASLGIRYRPDYQDKMHLEVTHVPVDCTTQVERIRTMARQGTPLMLEQILTEARLPVMREHVQRGTLIYTHYVRGIVEQIRKALAADGWRVGTYTGDDKTGLQAFLRGTVDVLIGSGAIATGVDGLQAVCNRLLVNVLPWTHAEWEQLLGRVYRQGQRRARVDVIIAHTFATVRDQRWSADDVKWQRIQFKKSLADAAVDGIVPEGQLRSAEQAYRDTLSWLDRLMSEGVIDAVHTPMHTTLSDIVPARRKHLGHYGDLSQLNRRWNHTNSDILHARLRADPDEWKQYHDLYRAARQLWPLVPYQEVITWLQRRQGKVVGDFGCGEALIAAAVADRHEVHSFDHIAIHNGVVAGDMAHTPLDDESLDVAVFCLSLMGANFTDYLREAHRTLKMDGFLHIWEASSRFADARRFATDLEALGFAVIEVRDAAPFTHIAALKTDREPEAGCRLRFR